MKKSKSLRKPDWIGIGGRHCGTSWVYANLFEHPQIHTPIKEINYFHNDNVYFRGESWYKAHWSRARKKQIIGEYSTAYLYSEKALARIRKDYPDVKILVNIRNPIRRTRSAYINGIQTGLYPATTPFCDAVRNHPMILDNSYFYKYTSKYIDAFGRDRVHISVFDLNHKELIISIYDFLEVDTDPKSSKFDTVIGHSYIPRSRLLDAFLLRTAKNIKNIGFHNLHWLIKSTGLPELIRKLNSRSAEKYNFLFSQDDIVFLRELLADDIVLMGKTLNIDLNKLWL